MKKYPAIGSKFTGKNAMANTQTGEYWSVLPSISTDEVKLQKALLKTPKGRLVGLVGIAATAVLLSASPAVNAQSQDVKVCYFGGTNKTIVIPKDQPCPNQPPN